LSITDIKMKLKMKMVSTSYQV